VRQRLALFRRAYPVNPDYVRFLRETSHYLANKELASIMWNWVEAATAANSINPSMLIERYIRKVSECAAEIRRLAAEGHRSGTEIVGINAHAQIVESQGLATRPVTKRGGGQINALGRAKSFTCFWCGKAGHRIAECPAKKQGLPKVVQDAPRKNVFKRKIAAVQALLKDLEEGDEDEETLELAEQLAGTHLDEDFLEIGNEEESYP